jgi:hypothetical protein
MKGQSKQFFDVKIDKLTNSVENTISKDSFKTDVLPVSIADLKNIKKKDGWRFDWFSEFKEPGRTVYKLVIRENVKIVQGLISLTPTADNIFMNLIESAPFNFGVNKLYTGVPGNLVAFACKQSFLRGTGGYVSFRSKTQLIKHYEATLGAVHFGGHLMIINTNAALKLIEKYFEL